MMDNKGQPRHECKGMFVATLLATTMIAGGGLAWSKAGATDVATAPLGLASVVNQAGFGDLAAKVGPAVVNIATTEGVDQVAEQEGPDLQQQMPNFPPGSPFAVR